MNNNCIFDNSRDIINSNNFNKLFMLYLDEYFSPFVWIV